MILTLFKQAMSTPSGVVAAILIALLIGWFASKLVNYLTLEKSDRKKLGDWQDKQEKQNTINSTLIGNNGEQIEILTRTTGEHLKSLAHTVELHVKDKTIHEQSNVNIEEVEEDIKNLKKVVRYEDTCDAIVEGLDKRVARLEVKNSGV